MRPCQNILAAVSGGPDSVALLHVLLALSSSWKLRITVCHLNHRLRGDDSDEDAAFVLDLANQLGLSCISDSCDVHRLAAEKRLGLEEAGREARMSFYHQAREQCQADRIALGHNRDDQAETVLHRVLRGSGLRGLSGILPVRDGLFIRPLLCVSREDILIFLNDRRQSYRQDCSNEDRTYLRNRIRHDLLPLLEKQYNQQIRLSLVRLAELARADSDYLEAQAAAAFLEVSCLSTGAVQWHVTRMDALPKALRTRVVMQALKMLASGEWQYDSGHVEAVLDLMASGKSGKSIRLPGGIQARREFGHITLAHCPTFPEESFETMLSIPGQVVAASGAWVLKAYPGASALAGTESCDRAVAVATVSLHSATDQLYVRSPRPGDVYRLRHSRKLKKLWSDAKIPVSLRSSIPLIFDGSALLWIPGFAAARNFVKPAGFQKEVKLQMECDPASPLGRWLIGRGPL
jgi:tRNA(Ile)-lysidine synthase